MDEGVTREELLQQRQEDLSLVVEPLVDSISELVLSSVTGSFDNVQSNCMDIADRTNKLVLIAQQVATSSTDVDLQIEVADSINAVAESIEKLVTSFSEILGDSNPRTQEAFAAAAKYVGEAINKLCAATDETSQQKVISAVREAIVSAKEVQDSAHYGSERLFAAAQNNVEKTVKLVKVATLASSSTADEKKKRLLLDGANRVKVGGPSLIQAAKLVSDRPQDSIAQSDLESRANELTEAFNILINAAKLSPTYFGKVAETYEYVRKLIEAAQDLEEAATNLFTMTKQGTTEQFIDSAKAAASKALLLVNQAENAMKMEKDAVKKQTIKDAIAELRDASSCMIKAAKAYRENPNDPENKRILEECHRRLEGAIQNMVAITGGEMTDNSPKGKLAMCLTALESAARNVALSAQNNPKNLVEDANALVAIAMQMTHDIEQYAAGETDPVVKKRLLENASELKNAVQMIIAAAKKVALNPNDPQALKELQDAQKYLLDRLTQIKKDAHIGTPGVESQDSNNNTANYEFSVAGKEEQQLINAAREEASAALQLVSEAEKLADKVTDPAKKAQLKLAIKEVQLCSQRVIEMAELVSKNPKDQNAQNALTQAQKELGDAIHKVVGLSNNANDKELTDAMDEMKSETGGSTGGNKETTDLLTSAQDVLTQIALSFGSNQKMTPEETITNAKQLSTKAQDLAKQLREMAAKTTDPIYKEKLLTSAKIIRDGSIQIKILSAVKAASNKDDKSNAVAMAAKLLQTNITDIIKEVQSEGIRNRFRSTVKQTIAINKVVNVFKKKINK